MKLLIYVTISLISIFSHAFEIKIEKLKNNKGKVICYLFQSEDGFPTKESKAIEKVVVEIGTKNESVCTFKTSLANSLAAISVIHDEDLSGAMSANFIGIPKEGDLTGLNQSSF